MKNLLLIFSLTDTHYNHNINYKLIDKNLDDFMDHIFNFNIFI